MLGAWPSASTRANLHDVAACAQDPRDPRRVLRIGLLAERAGAGGVGQALPDLAVHAMRAGFDDAVVGLKDHPASVKAKACCCPALKADNGALMRLALAATGMRRSACHSSVCIHSTRLVSSRCVGVSSKVRDQTPR